MALNFLNSLRSKPAAWWLQTLLLPLLVWIALIKFPHAPDSGLDDSWRMALGYAADRNLQHGTEFIFTYGPLGHLTALTYVGAHFWPFMTWQLLSNAVFAWVLCRFARRMPARRQAIFYGYLLLFGTIYPDAMQMLLIAVLSLMLLRPENQRPGWAGFTGLSFAILSLIKFTNLMLCGFILVVLVVHWLTRREPRLAGWLSGTFLAVFLGLWLGLGQGLASLPAYFRYGLELSLGYVEAMAVYETPAMTLFGAGALLAIALYGLVHLFTQPDRRTALAAVLILGAVSYINWKHGFVRADGHVLAHFVICLMIVASHPALLADQPVMPRLKGGLLLAAAAFSFGGLWALAPFSLARSPAMLNRRLYDTVDLLCNLPALQRSFDAKLAQLKQKVALPTLSRIIGRATVDQLADEQSYAILNGLNFTPRPALQGYTTYTAALNRLDESFYRSERGPQFVFTRYNTIDDRFPTLDDSLSLRFILQHYDFVLENGGLLLFERPEGLVPGDPAEADGTLLQKTTVRFGDRIEVPDAGGRPVWAVIRIRPNLAGQLRKFLYKLPLLSLQVSDSEGAKSEYQLVRQMAATGFILNPLFTSTTAISSFQDGSFHRRAETIRLVTAPGGERWFANDIEVEFRALAPFKQALVNANENLNRRFRMMNRRPVKIEAAVAASSVIEFGRELLLLHAPGRMEFSLDEPAARMRGNFGLVPGASQAPNHTDGVEFVIEWLAPDGTTRPLFRRLLDPLNRPEDRPLQSFDLDLTACRGGRLVLLTLPGPACHKDFDWSCWTDLVFTPQP